jgi:RND family efflux transporter MFP subunit
MIRRGGAVLVVVLLALGLVAVRVKRAREKAQAPRLVPTAAAVEVARVRQGALAETRHFLGEVSGVEQAALSSRIVAPVIAVAVREGDRVRRGQELVRLEAGELDDAVQAAQAGVAAAEVAASAQRAATARDRVLVEAKAISQEEWERSSANAAATEARLLAAREALDSARRRRAYATLAAPFDGVVSVRSVDPGDLASPGKPLLTLVREGGVRVRVQIPAEMLGGLAVGRTLSLEAPGGPVAGRIARVFPAMDVSHLATIEADLRDAPRGLVSGATIGVDVEVGSASGWVVPARALLESEKGAYVFRANGGRAQPLAVRVASRDQDEAVVSGSLQPGDDVVLAQPSRLMTLVAGTPLTIIARADR